MPNNLWCRWETSDLGERPRRECRQPTTGGANYCPTHQARLPIWPAGDSPKPYHSSAGALNIIRAMQRSEAVITEAGGQPNLFPEEGA